MINHEWQTENFGVGDYVYVANTILGSSPAFPAKVVKVLEGAEAGDLGKHYVLLVSSHVDDFLRVDSALYVWRSLEQRQKAADREKERAKEVRKKGEELRKQLFSLKKN